LFDEPDRANARHHGLTRWAKPLTDVAQSRAIESLQPDETIGQQAKMQQSNEEREGSPKIEIVGSNEDHSLFPKAEDSLRPYVMTSMD